MSKKQQIQRPFRRKKTGAICPHCNVEMTIVATKGDRHTDKISGESLVTRYVRCPQCQCRAVNLSHTKLIK